ncbi:MAG: hypothetical protein ACP5EN_12915 [Rhodovulum sp.]
MAVLKPYTEGHPTRWVIAPQKLIALKSFAQTCRAHDRQPWQVDLAFMQELESLYQGNRRTSNRTAARRMDEYRTIPEALPLLPPQPIGFTREHQHAPLEIPAAFAAEFEPWVIAATEKDWDPVAQENTTRNEKHAHVARAACRTYLRCAVSEGALEAGANSCLPVFLDEERAADVARALITRIGLPNTQGGLTRRTVRKYLKTICQVLRAAGHEPVTLEQVLKANRDLKDAAKDDKTMTPENQAFCERLIARRDLRLKFLNAYLDLRRAAEAILDTAKAEGRGLTKRERSRVCILGMCACFAAIEFAGAPLRISNVLEATLFGEAAWITLPQKGKTKPIKVFIPAAHTKAKKEDSRFEIRPNKYRGHETILWFVREIRPLIPGAKDNLYLFPSPRKPGAPISDKWFRAEFCNVSRSIVGLPMNPHQFRHGQASLLINKHPEELLVIAKRTGHTVDSLLRFYAFIDTLKAMERGQDLMIGLIDD